jgi:hypothetical protein
MARARAPGVVVAPAEEQSQAAQERPAAVLSWAVEARGLGGEVAQQSVAERQEGAVARAEPEPQPQAARALPGAVAWWTVGESGLAWSSSPWAPVAQRSPQVSGSACGE